MGVEAKKKSHNKRLGKGLDALLGDAPRAKPALREAGAKQELPISLLHPRTGQPRRRFDAATIDELAASIKARGLLQPILARPRPAGDYEIVAGERRWRAAQKAKLHNVPVIIRELTDEETAEVALVENVQRVDLNPVEEARGLARLAEDYKRTQEEIAEAVGKSRSHVANMLRLLSLPQIVLAALESGQIAMGHARALLGAKDPAAACRRIVAAGLSVRQTEVFVKQSAAGGRAAGKSSEKSKASSGKKDADTRALERDLAAVLGLEVSIAHARNGAGALTIRYLDLDQLDDLCRRLTGAGV